MSLSLQVILHDVLKFLFVYILFLLGFGVGNCFTTNSNAHACKATYLAHWLHQGDIVPATFLEQLDQVGVITPDLMD